MLLQRQSSSPLAPQGCREAALFWWFPFHTKQQPFCSAGEQRSRTSLVLVQYKGRGCPFALLVCRAAVLLWCFWEFSNQAKQQPLSSASWQRSTFLLGLVLLQAKQQPIYLLCRNHRGKGAKGKGESHRKGKERGRGERRKRGKNERKRETRKQKEWILDFSPKSIWVKAGRRPARPKAEGAKRPKGQ